MRDDDLDRLIQALEPSWLDWASGLVVPLLLGLLTLWVAISSRNVAKRAIDETKAANEAALRAQNADRRRRLVGPLMRLAYAHGGKSYAEDAAEKLIDQIVQDTHDMVAGEGYSARALVGWIQRRMEETLALTGRDRVFAQPEAYESIRETLWSWVEDPTTVDELVQNEARLQALVRATKMFEADASRPPEPSV